MHYTYTKYSGFQSTTLVTYELHANLTFSIASPVHPEPDKVIFGALAALRIDCSLTDGMFHETDLLEGSYNIRRDVSWNVPFVDTVTYTVQ